MPPFKRDDQAAHLSRGPGGLAGVVSRLRRDVYDALVAPLLANPLFIENPALPYNANRTFLQLYTAKEAVSLWAPTATRKLDPRTLTVSVACSIIKVNTAAFGLVIDVTTGGTAGWTTPAGLNTDYTLFNSDGAQSGSWLVVIDQPRKIVYATPLS